MQRSTLAILLAVAGCVDEESPPAPIDGTGDIETMTTVPPTSDGSSSGGDICDVSYAEYECRGFVAGVYEHPTTHVRGIVINGNEYYNCLDFGAVETCEVDIGNGMDMENPENGTEQGAIETILDACRAKCEAKVAAGVDGYTFPASIGTGTSQWNLQDEVCVFEHDPDGCVETGVCGAGESMGGCGFIDGVNSPEQVQVSGDCPDRDEGDCPEVSCSGWNPVSQTQATGLTGSTPKVNIDDDFWAVMAQNPALLIGCDTGRFVQHDNAEGGPAPWRSFESLVAGDFLHEIGLRSGDRDISIKIGANYWPLVSSDNMLDAFNALGAATTFRIKYKRGGVFKPEIAVKLLECGSNCPNPTW